MRKMPAVKVPQPGGAIYDPDKPDASMLPDVHALARRLSRVFRWGAAVDYSVCSHSCDVAAFLEAGGFGPTVVRSALFHDASEAMICDIPHGMKRKLPVYREWEAKLMEVMSRAYGFDWSQPSPAIHAADALGADAEAKKLLGIALDWDGNHPALGWNLADRKYALTEGETPTSAVVRFLGIEERTRSGGTPG